MTREQFLKFERKLNTLDEARAEMTKLNTVYGLTEARAINAEMLGMYNAIELLTGKPYYQWYSDFIQRSEIGVFTAQKDSQTNGLAKAEGKQSDSEDNYQPGGKLTAFPEVLDCLKLDEIESLR